MPTLTEIRAGLKRPFRIGLLTGVLAIIIVLGIQFALLRELSVFNTGLGPGSLPQSSLLSLLCFWPWHSLDHSCLQGFNASLVLGPPGLYTTFFSVSLVSLPLPLG